jgi:hypothetical protein
VEKITSVGWQFHVSLKKQTKEARDDWCRAHRVGSRRCLCLRFSCSVVAHWEILTNVQSLQHHPDPRSHAEYDYARAF